MCELILRLLEFSIAAHFISRLWMHCQWHWRTAYRRAVASMWIKCCYFMWFDGDCRQEVDVEHRIERAMNFICWHDMFQVSWFIIFLSMFAPFNGPTGHGCAPIYAECNLAVERNIPFHISFYFISFRFFSGARYGAGQIRLTHLISAARQLTYIRWCDAEG